MTKSSLARETKIATMKPMAERIILGIDPGVHGAIVVATPDAARIVAIHDMPTVKVLGKNRVLENVLASLLRDYVDGCEMVVTEELKSVHTAGRTQVFQMGANWGIIRGVLATLGPAWMMTRPQVWTKALDVGSDKGKHLQAAIRLWPSHAKSFARASDDGRADAALLCHWYARRHAAKGVA